MIAKKHRPVVIGFVVLVVVIVVVMCAYWLPKDQLAGETEGGPDTQAIAKKTTERSPEVIAQHQEETKGEVTPQTNSAPKVRKSRSLRRPGPRRAEMIRLIESRREELDSVEPPPVSGAGQVKKVQSP